MTIAAYVRVSTQRQVQAQSIEQQLERLQAHCASQGWELLNENIFRDDGYSGASLNRPGLDALRDKARAREIDRVLITAPDRLARNFAHQALLLEELEQQGCAVAFLDRPMGADPHEQLLLQIRGAVAEYERTLIAERMRRGRQARLRAGTLLPGTRLPYGYRANPERPRDPQGVTVEPAAAAIISEMFALYLEPGATLMSLADRLHQGEISSPTGKPYWRPETVRTLLTNPTYTGTIYAGRFQTRPAQHRRSPLQPTGKRRRGQLQTAPQAWLAVTHVPAIVSQEIFDQVQAKLAKNQVMARRNNHSHQYLLRGLVSCGHCQTSCTGRGSNGGHHYYVCSTRSGAGTYQFEKPPCKGRLAPAQQLDDLVWADLCELLSHPEAVAQALQRARQGEWLPQGLQARRTNLSKGRLSLERQLDRLSDAYLQGVIPLVEYQRRRPDLERRLQTLDSQMKQLEAQVDLNTELAVQVASAQDFCARVRPLLAEATFEQKRKLVELLIDRVVFTDDQVEIRYVVPLDPHSETVRFCQLYQDYREFV